MQGALIPMTLAFPCESCIAYFGYVYAQQGPGDAAPKAD